MKRLCLSTWSFFISLGVIQNRSIKSLSIIGAGNIGWHLGIAFRRSGLHIKSIISRDRRKGEELAVRIGASYVDSIECIESIPDVFVICVQDKEIKGIVDVLKEKEIPLLHVSGSTSIDVFSFCKSEYGVIYPLQTFTRGVEMTYEDIPFLLEASSSVFMNCLEDLAARVTNKILHIHSKQRLKIHVAAVYACNFSNHMAAIAEKILKEEGLNLELIRPLMGQTFEKLSTKSPLKVQTGPAVRNDEETIQKHIKALTEYASEKELYELISQQIIRYRKQGDE